MGVTGWDGDSTKLKGPDDTEIGNVRDRLKTNTQLSDGPQLDAFSRLRVSNPSVIFDTQFTDSAKDFLFSDVTTTGGTVTRNSTSADIELSVTSASGSRALRQTREYMRYTPGQSLFHFTSGAFGAGKANCIQRFGFYDDNDGVFIQLNGTTPQVVLRSNVTGTPVETIVSQSSWNLDPLNGTGTSGLTLDLTKQQIFLVDLQWLGSGRIRFGFDLNGVILYCHEMIHANVISTKYSRRSSLPLRAEIINTGATSGSTTMHLTCMSLITEGVERNRVAVRSFNTESNRTIGTSFEPVFAIRLKSAFIRGNLEVIKAMLQGTSLDFLIWRMLIGSTVTGGTWTSAGSNSIAEYNSTATSFSGGDIIDSGFTREEGNLSVDSSEFLQSIAANYAGTSDIAVLVARSDSTTANVLSGLTWRELY